MALSETTEYDRIEVVTKWRHVQVRKATVITKDGVELARSFHRHVLHPNDDISGEPNDVVAVCNAVWTDEVKDAWKTHLASISPE